MSDWTEDELARIVEAGEGHIESGGVSKDVLFTSDSSKDALVDSAYRAKCVSGRPVTAITGTTATITTMRVDPL